MSDAGSKKSNVFVFPSFAGDAHQRDRDDHLPVRPVGSRRQQGDGRVFEEQEKQIEKKQGRTRQRTLGKDLINLEFETLFRFTILASLHAI